MSLTVTSQQTLKLNMIKGDSHKQVFKYARSVMWFTYMKEISLFVTYAQKKFSCFAKIFGLKMLLVCFALLFNHSFWVEKDYLVHPTQL